MRGADGVGGECTCSVQRRNEDLLARLETRVTCEGDEAVETIEGDDGREGAELGDVGCIQC